MNNKQTTQYNAINTHLQLSSGQTHKNTIHRLTDSGRVDVARPRCINDIDDLGLAIRRAAQVRSSRVDAGVKHSNNNTAAVVLWVSGEKAR